jgi:hypothetical protein
LQVWKCSSLEAGYKKREDATGAGLGQSADHPRQMSYDLRRLRLHGLIEGIASTQRCELTALGRRTALFYSRAFNRVVLAYPKYPIPTPPDSFNLTAAFHHLEVQLTN